MSDMGRLLDYLAKLVDVQQGSLRTQAQGDSGGDDVLANLTFAATTGDVAGVASVHLPFFQLKNPAGSGKRLRLKTLWLATCVSTNNNIFKGYIRPDVSLSGTLLGIVNAHVAVPLVVSAALVFLKPTATVLASNQLFTVCVGPTSTLPMITPWILEPGEDFLITCRNNAANTTAAVTAQWSEETV